MSLHHIYKTIRNLVSGRKFIRDVGVLTIANVIGAALSLVQGILVARWLGPELYGLAALVIVYPGLIYTFLDARSGEATVKYLSEFHAQGKIEQVLAICQLGFLVDAAIAVSAFGIVLFSASWAAERIAHYPAATWLMVAYAAAFIPRVGLATSQSVLTSLGKFHLIAFLTTATTALRVALILGLVLAGWQVTGVIVGNILSMTIEGLVFGVIGWILIKRRWGGSVLQGDWRTLKGRRREIFGFLAYNDLSALLGMIPKQLDIVFLGYFRNLTEVGYYKLGKTLAGMVGLIVTPLQSVTYPELARLWGLKDRIALKKKVHRLMIQIGLPLGIVVLFGNMMVPYLLPLFFGENYLPASMATQYLLLGATIWIILFWLRPVYMVCGKAREWFIFTTLNGLISMLTYPFLINHWGYNGLSASFPAITLLTYGTAFLKIRYYLLMDRHLI